MNSEIIKTTGQGLLSKTRLNKDLTARRGVCRSPTTRRGYV